MFAMEMENEEPDDPLLVELFADIKKTLSLGSINSDYLTLAQRVLRPGTVRIVLGSSDNVAAELIPLLIRGKFRIEVTRLLSQVPDPHR
jgi:hypothetical protein